MYGLEFVGEEDVFVVCEVEVVVMGVMVVVFGFVIVCGVELECVR